MLLLTHLVRPSWGRRRRRAPVTQAIDDRGRDRLLRRQASAEPRRDRLVADFQNGEGRGALVLVVEGRRCRAEPHRVANHGRALHRWWNPATEGSGPRPGVAPRPEPHRDLPNRLICPGTVDEQVEEGRRRQAPPIAAAGPAEVELGGRPETRSSSRRLAFGLRPRRAARGGRIVNAPEATSQQQQPPAAAIRPAQLRHRRLLAMPPEPLPDPETRSCHARSDGRACVRISASCRSRTTTPNVRLPAGNGGRACARRSPRRSPTHADLLADSSRAEAAAGGRLACSSRLLVGRRAVAPGWRPGLRASRDAARVAVQAASGRCRPPAAPCRRCAHRRAGSGDRSSCLTRCPGRPVAGCTPPPGDRAQLASSTGSLPRPAMPSGERGRVRAAARALAAPPRPSGRSDPLGRRPQRPSTRSAPVMLSAAGPTRRRPSAITSGHAGSSSAKATRPAMLGAR